MRIAMKHPAYKGGAKVLPEQQAIWEAAGWVAIPQTPKKTPKKETE